MSGLQYLHMGYLNTFITKQAAGFTGPVPLEGMSHAQWNNFAKELGPLTGQTKSFYRNSAAMSDYMAQHGLRNMDDLTSHIQGLRGGGAPAVPHAAPAASRAPLGLPAPANTPINPAGAVEIVDDVPTSNMRNVSSRVRPAGAPVTPAPTTTAIVPHQAPAPTTTALVPHQAPAAAPAPANKSINYARRTWNSAKSLGRNAVGMGKQGFNAVRALAKRNPKMAALLAIGGTLAGGSLMAGAANSGRPPVRQSDAMNPYAGLESY